MFVRSSPSSRRPLASRPARPWPATRVTGVAAAAAWFAFAPAMSAQTCPLSMAPAVNYADATPRSLAVGDFNGDGKLDLAVANSTANNVSILLGTGTGSFDAATNFAAGTHTQSVAVGDFNGDGRPDLAVANTTANNVSILLGTGTGTGTFGAAANFAVGTAPVSVVVGDFSGGGKLDLAVANFTSNNVSILLNTGGSPPPVFTQQPIGQAVQSGSPAVFTAAANGFGAVLTYQWRRNGTPLADGGPISGASTSTLTISPALTADIASYDLQATSPAACGGAAQIVTSAGALLFVTAPTSGACCHGATCTLTASAAACAGSAPSALYLGDNSACSPPGRNGPMNPCCPADFSGSGTVEVFDIFAFLNAWFTGCP